MEIFDAIAMYTDAIYSTRKYGDRCMTEHLDFCVEFLKKCGCTDEDVLAAMLGHELIEDQVCDFGQIELVANTRVANWIQILARDDRTYSEYITSILSVTAHDPIPAILKLVDVHCHITFYILDGVIKPTHLSRYVIAEAKLKAKLQETLWIPYNMDTEAMLTAYFLKD